MTTSGLISFIQQKARDWDRSVLLDILNTVQNMVFTTPSYAMRAIDPSTGKDPLLTTYAGQLEYVLDVTAFGFDIQHISSVGGTSESDIGPYNQDANNDTLNTDYTSFKAVGGKGATIMFASDPGDGTKSVQCYKKPTQLTSEKIQLSVPEEYHMTTMAAGVIGMLEKLDHGASNSWDEFVGRTLPLLQQAMNTERNTRIQYNQGGGY